MKKVIIVIYSLVLIVICVGTLAGVKSNIVVPENRKPSPLPEFNFSKMLEPSYLHKFTSYISDNFFLRKFGIKYYNQLIYSFFNSSQNSKVVFGKNDWIFYGEKNNFRDFLKKDPLTDSYMECIENDLQTLVKHYSPVPIYIMINSNKHHIYPELHPLSNYYSNTPTKQQQIESFLTNKNFKNLIPIYQTLINGKSQHDVYLKTDTHWSSYGAMLATKKFFHLLTLNNPEIDSSKFPIFKVDKRTITHGNFTYITSLNLEESFRNYISTESAGKKSNIPDAFKAYFLPKDRGQYFYNKSKKSKIFVVGDSFFGKLNYYLSTFNKEVLYFNPWNRDTKNSQLDRWPYTLIEKFKPDIILIQFVERRLKDKQIADRYYYRCN